MGSGAACWTWGWMPVFTGMTTEGGLGDGIGRGLLVVGMDHGVRRDDEKGWRGRNDQGERGGFSLDMKIGDCIHHHSSFWSGEWNR